MLIDVPARFGVRHRVRLNARDGVFKPYLRRESAVVLFGVHSAGAVVFCRHSVTLRPCGRNSTETERRTPAETNSARQDSADSGRSGWPRAHATRGMSVRRTELRQSL